MNTERRILNRLLHLFPLAEQRQYFTHTSKTYEEIINEITTRQTAAAIHAFASEKFNFTKQHIFLFEAPARLATALTKKFMGFAHTTRANIPGGGADSDISTL